MLFGEEMVLAQFQRHPLAMDGAMVIASPSCFAAFADESALFGDLYDGHIGRLWRLDPAAVEDIEPAVSVAFDPDLTQARGDLFARAEDHPDLAPAAFATVREAGHALLAEVRSAAAPPFRVRAWLVRAVGTAGSTAGLYALHQLGDEVEGRSAGFTYAAVLVEGGTIRVLRDGAGEAQRLAAGWTPRLVT